MTNMELEPDLQDIDERLWELYVMNCEQHKVTPSLKDFIIWKEEQYD